MVSHKPLIFITLLALSVVLAHPLVRLPEGELMTRGTNDNQQIVERNPAPAPKSPNNPKVPLQYNGGGVVADARKANNAPGREIPKLCKKLQDCTCPKTAKSTSCINGKCQCDNPAINFIGNKFMEAVKAIGNAAITKVMGHLMQGIATVKQVAEVVAGAVLGPQARAALKIALKAVPDTGPSHIDKATKGALSKILG